MTSMMDNEQWLQAAAQLKAYVTAGDAQAYADCHENTVVLDLTHSNLIQQHIEIRFDKHQTVDDLRHKIYQKTGTPHHFQHLQVYNGSQLRAEIPPTEVATRKLGYYSLQHGMRVHCVDINPNSISRGGALENVSLVKKYQMSDEEYNKRKNTLRNWEQEQKAADPSFTLAKHGQEHKALVDAKRMRKLGLPLPEGFEVVNGEVVRIKSQQDAEFGEESVKGITIDMRCEVQPGGRRGTVKFVGEVPELGGYWVGISFDEPLGKSDGSIGGKQYFEAFPKHGGFCRGKNVKVGDFPERDLFDEDSSSEDEL
jgi:tubulin-folding cofactor B